jgi:hypothetical protein
MLQLPEEGSARVVIPMGLTTCPSWPQRSEPEPKLEPEPEPEPELVLVPEPEPEPEPEHPTLARPRYDRTPATARQLERQLMRWRRMVTVLMLRRKHALEPELET